VSNEQTAGSGAQVSVVVPARDEETLLPDTLKAVRAAAAELRSERDEDVELVVVDNCSHDATADVARQLGARVVPAPEGSIAAVRNAGAAAAHGAILVFVDADVRIPPHALVSFVAALDDDACEGGYPTVIYQPRKRTMRTYLRLYRAFARLTGMSQGSAQFCRKRAFDAIGGYDEKIFMGEDVDFMRRLRRAGEGTRAVTHVDDVELHPSSRRFDTWPVWKTLIFTNPLLIRPFMRRPGMWAGWYRDAPR